MTPVDSCTFRHGLVITNTELADAPPQTPAPVALIIKAVVPVGSGLLAITSSLVMVQGMVGKVWFFHSVVAVEKPTAALWISPVYLACTEIH